MRKVYIIYGLPGSGKTTLGNGLAARSPHNSLFIDDIFTNYKEKVAKFDPSVHENIIITDPRFCGGDERVIHNQIIQTFKLDEEVEFVSYYFENDPEACILNARRDPKPGGTENFIKRHTKNYTIPPNAMTIPVYREFEVCEVGCK